MLYKLSVDHVKSLFGFSDAQIFDFIGHPGEEDFQKNFDFCQGAIANLSFYCIGECFYFYKDGTDFSAGAYRKDNNSYIRVNRGLVEKFERIFGYLSIDDIEGLSGYRETIVALTGLTNPLSPFLSDPTFTGLK
jgi:hypothetical protein